MKKMTIWILLAVTSLLLTACAEATLPADAPVSNTPEPGTPITNPTTQPTVISYAPQPGDKNMTSGKVYLEGADILALEIYPPQFMLHVAGNLPNPCYNLRIKVNPPDAKNNLMVEVYTVTDPKMACIEVTTPFDASVHLETGLAPGKYAVWVNGEPTGDIEIK